MEPRITNTLIGRCLSDGSLNDEGTYAYVSFIWECDENVSSITFQWKSDTDPEWNIETIPSSGKSGTVERIVGNGSLSPEIKYYYAVSVTTASTETIKPGSLLSSRYFLDQMKEDKAIGIGRTAELEGVCDIEYRTRMAGGILQPMLSYGTDLDDVTIPNTYTGGHVGPEKYKNCPVANGTIVLRVETSGDDDEIMQTLIQCHKYAPKIFTRCYYNGAWGEWMRADPIESILYENNSGSGETVTLSQSVSEFKSIDIYYCDNNGRGNGYTKVLNPNGKLVHLGLQEAAATTVFLRQTVYTISDKSITPNIEAASIVRITTANGAVPTMGTNYIKITKVIGRG